MINSTAKVIASLASGATAAGIGAAASGGSTAGAATAFNADMNNRQLHPDEKNLLKKKAAEFADKLRKEGYSAMTEERALAILTEQADTCGTEQNNTLVRQTGYPPGSKQHRRFDRSRQRRHLVRRA